MFGNIHKAERQVSDGISREKPKGNPEAILEGFSTDVHLVSAEVNADVDVVLAADQIEGIREAKDVGATLKRSVAAIAKGEVSVGKQDRNQTAAVGTRRTRFGSGSTGAAQVGEGNAGAGEVSGSATVRALGSDVIEDAVIAEAELIDGGGGKEVSLADGDVAGVVEDSLVTAKSAGLGEGARAAAARNVGGGLIVAKAREDIIGAGKSVIHADIELGFEEAAHGLVGEINSVSRVIGIGQRIEIDQGGAKRVDERGGYFSAVGTGNLAAVGVDRGRWAGVGDGARALERGAVGVRVGECSSRLRHTEIVGTEIRVRLRGTGVHGGGGNQAGGGDGVELSLSFAVDEKESLVFLNRAADGTAKLVQVKLFWRGSEETLGVEIRVTEKLEQRAVETVAAALRGDEDGGPGASAVLRGVVVGQNLEFLNVVDGRESADTTGGELVVVDAVEKPVRAVGTRAADREREGAAGGDLAARSGGEEAVRIGLGRGAGGERSELHKVPAIQGELRNFLRGDDLAEGWAGGLNGDGVGGDFDSGALRGWRQREIELTCFVDLQAQIPGDSGLEAGEVNLNGVDTDGEQRNEVMAGFISDRIARDAGALRGGRDGGSGDA